MVSPSESSTEAYYARNADNYYVPRIPVDHKEDEYDSDYFHLLAKMQDKNFWYCGRHRFLRHILLKTIDRERYSIRDRLRAIDLGGGCGGWIRYLQNRDPGLFHELALSDSSPAALQFAMPILGETIQYYQTDLLRLGWENRWDVTFLLDVLEHIPNHQEVIDQIHIALRPSGLLFVTAPAFPMFWNVHDEMAKHQRRYVRKDFQTLADRSGLRLIDSRYFMFFLSPLYVLSRLRLTRKGKPTDNRYSEKTLSWFPPASINQLLKIVFCAETPVGAIVPFPWGTSVLGIFQKAK